MSSMGYQIYCLLIIFFIVNLLSASKAKNHHDDVSTDSINGPRAVSTLKFLTLVSRHGSRGLVHTYPKNPYPADDRTFWPNGRAQLTNKGRVQMFNLGTKIRYLYNGFLSEHYFFEDFKAYSTVVDRTLMSAQLFLAGLFPPKSFQVWHKQLPWQPIPVFPNYFDHSTYVDGSQKCLRFAQDQKTFTEKFEKDNKSNLTAFFEPLEGDTNLVVSEGSFIPGIKSLWDSCKCADSEGLQLPEWTKSAYPEPLATYVYKAHFAAAAASDVMTRLIIGKMYGQIIEAMQATINGTSQAKMYYYSGHDITVLALQTVLGLQDSTSHLVDTGSALIFELHQDQHDSTYYIKVLFIDGGSVDLEPTILSLPICTNPCNFSVLENNTRKFFDISNYHQECIRQ